MFVGAELFTRVDGYLKRPRAEDDPWSHWKMAFVRHRYADEPHVYVVTHFFLANKIDGRWVEGETQFIHKTMLASYPNWREESACLRTVDGNVNIQDPAISSELRVACKEFKRKCRSGLIETRVLDECIRNASLREKESKLSDAA